MNWTLSYDSHGNVTGKGPGNDSYVFDAADRLQAVAGKESYRYDGHGRRVKVTRLSDGKSAYPIYTLGGQLLSEDDARANTRTDYVSLKGSLVGKRVATLGRQNWKPTYEHTDALHSPTVETDASGGMTRAEHYTPYGEPGDGRYVQGPGFTGHVTDAATGLTYAQQRYYDPVLGRFLSLDPVQADDKGEGFNRYWYAADNPYKFTDPDGRDTVVELQSYKIGSAPIQGDYGHQYVYMRDTDTGEAVISRAGPSAKYPGGSADVVSRSPVKDPGGNGNVKLVAEMKPAARSLDSNPSTGIPLGKTVPGSTVSLPGGIGAAKAAMQKFNSAVDAAKIDYKPLSTNSNAYAGTAYAALTGKPAPSSSVLPGSDVSLKPQISACQKNAASCGK